MAGQRSERWDALAAQAAALELDRSPTRLEALSRELIECDPEHEMGYRLGSRAKSLRGDHAGAIELAREALARRPEWAYLHYLLALRLRAAGELKEAKRHIDVAIETDADWAPAWIEAGWLAIQAKAVRRATECAAKALELAPDSADALYLQATTVLCEWPDRPRTHLAAMGNVLRADPQHAPAWRHRARALQALGQSAEAERACRTSLSIDPSDVDGRLLLFEILRERSFVRRLLRLPARLLAALGRGFQGVPGWLAVLGGAPFIGFALVLTLLVVLLVLLCLPAQILHDWLTTADLRRAAREISADAGPLRVHRWPTAVRWLLLLTLLVGEWGSIVAFLVRRDRVRSAVSFLAVSLGAALLLAIVGVLFAYRRPRPRHARLPEDPDEPGR